MEQQPLQQPQGQPPQVDGRRGILDTNNVEIGSPAGATVEQIRYDVAAAEDAEEIFGGDTARSTARLAAAILGPYGHQLEILSAEPRPSPALTSAALVEANKLYQFRMLPAEYVSWVGWLGIWALHQQSAQDSTRKLPTDGEVYNFYLELEDTDPADPHLLSALAEHYVGTYRSLAEMIRALTEVDHWQQLVEEFADRHGIGRYIDLNRDRITADVLEAYDVRARHGRIIVFEK